MNLYFRLIWTLIISRFKKPVSVLNDFCSNHIVWPNDLDVLGHMNNGRYFTVTDIARLQALIRAGIWQAMKRRKIYPVIAAESVQFFRPLMPWQKYSILTGMRAWDAKFFYIEHRFVSKGKLVALMLIKVRVIGDGNVRVAPADVLRFVHSGDVDNIRMDELIGEWNSSCQTHWTEKKNYRSL
jgi:acyl-CoA thioesterase FadM